MDFLTNCFFIIYTIINRVSYGGRKEGGREGQRLTQYCACSVHKPVQVSFIVVMLVKSVFLQFFHISLVTAGERGEREGGGEGEGREGRGERGREAVNGGFSWKPCMTRHIRRGWAHIWWWSKLILTSTFS